MNVSAYLPESPNKAGRLRLSLSNTVLSLALIVDQLLLPMFHIGGVPYKIGYLILGFWLVNWLSCNTSDVSKVKDTKRVFIAFSIIVSCMAIGEMWLTFSYDVPSHYEASRNILTFMFAALAFGLGRSSTKFQLDWLLSILFVAIALNFLFIILKNDLPSWLIDFYYTEKATSDAVGFQSVEEIIALVRPRGLFGNPNASMLMVNIIALAICVALRKRVLVIMSLGSASSLIILPVILSALLASRGEFVVSCVLGYLNFKNLSISFGSALKNRLIVVISFAVVGASIFSSTLEYDFSTNIERAMTVMEVLDKTNDDTDSTIARPLNQFSDFMSRFPHSPLWGTGISLANYPGFSEGTQYFHNDWFYIVTTSGLLGFFSLIWMLHYFVRYLGWPVLIPFVLPGLVNTFMLNVPAFIAYFGMLGVLFSRIRSSNTPDCQKCSDSL